MKKEKQESELIITQDIKGRLHKTTKDELCKNAGILQNGKCIGYPKNFTDCIPNTMCRDCKKNQFFGV
jgi:hypothetical protein